MTDPNLPQVVTVIEVPVDKGETSNWFIPLWQMKLLHKLWSVRIAVVGAVLDGIYAGVPAFQYYVPPVYFMGLCIATMVAIVVTRTMNQTGIDF